MEIQHICIAGLILSGLLFIAACVRLKNLNDEKANEILRKTEKKEK